ncbi:hypothetical protein Tco_0884761 [Tanacetum coccineum]|uniref:Late embryogenesis abundant protein LEA-2 subgroup domain-containing protein n=1 Tax=Tanacetum coccineum TaxID=301880 RepID=A0ABQ4WYG4_9ASTR
MVARRRRISNGNYNQNFHRRWPRQLNIWGVIFVPFLVVVLALVYILVIEMVYHRGRVEIKDIDIDNFHLNYTFLNTTTVALNGKATLEVFFETSGNVERYFGDFNITSLAFPNDPIKSFSMRTETREKGKKDVVVVRFDTHPTTLTPEKIRVLNEWLAIGKFGTELSVEYEWNVKKEVYFWISPPVKYASFSCQIPYKARFANKSHPTRCVK